MLFLDEYREDFSKIADADWAIIDVQFHEATRLMSAQGLEIYIQSAKGLYNLGRGNDLVLAWFENIPLVVKECGEDCIQDCLTAAMKLSSMTSGEVIALMFASLPMAARRLGDPDLFRSYLTLIHQISAKAARGLRPMLQHIDELLSKLTISGLRAWANYGADAHKRDLPRLQEYFALKSKDSLKILQRERKGTLFVDTQRKLNFYLRALWGRDFFLRPTASDFQGFKPYIENWIMHLPDALDDYHGIAGLELYRAICTHQAAHIHYTQTPISAENLSQAQMFFIGLIEDARIEYLASLEFIGLKKLWGKFLKIEYETPLEHQTVEELEQFARALNDPQARTGDEFLDNLAQSVHEDFEKNPYDNQISWHRGLELYNHYAAQKSVPSLRILNAIRIPYRCDNRFIWEFAEWDFHAQNGNSLSQSQSQIRKYVSVMEMANEVDTELAGDDAQEVWICKDEFMPYEDAGEATTSFNDMWGKEPISAPYHYHEWDYQVQLNRPDWTTVYERRATKGSSSAIDEILMEYKPVTQRIRKIIDMLSPAGVQRVRNMEDGDEIDLNAAIDAMIAIRMGEQPNPRITMRNVIHSRDLVVTVLLDLSESTNDPVANSDKTVLDLTKEAASLLATAINGIGDNFSIDGFASDGRHDVHYYKFKSFAKSFDDEAKARLDGMKGGLSTRMGAALRHAGQSLLAQSEQRKMILLVTDGAPADVDERDPQYLRHDTKRAVEELAAKGVFTYCLTLDRTADNYVKRIFGQNNYTIIDIVESLPEELPMLFASLTR